MGAREQLIELAVAGEVPLSGVVGQVPGLQVAQAAVRLGELALEAGFCAARVEVGPPMTVTFVTDARVPGVAHGGVVRSEISNKKALVLEVVGQPGGED
tara:strand:- start:5701 stop:5997 length:297 start_codon:yes stop_codon:yes gene_type:complete